MMGNELEFETVIGLEIHAQLATESKIFCSCSTEYGFPPNENTCPVCLGLPGALPVLNRKVVEFAVQLGLVTNCSINRDSQFARKNYFYPDLPKSYQISQYDRPLCEHGFLDIESNGRTKRIGINRIHLEEDAGKLVHEDNGNSSYVDLNRAGVPLVEIVSEPDLESSKEAKDYMEKLHAILTSLEICGGNMEMGQMRCDANVSIRPRGHNEYGTRTEIKNLNSFRFLHQSLEYEIQRHREELLEGHSLVQETRLWDSDRKLTFSMRTKEDAEEYRYFPDPDLPVIKLDEAWIEQLRDRLPELPDARRERYRNELDLSDYDAGLICGNNEYALYFEKVIAAGADPKQSCNWILGDLTRFMNERDCSILQLKIYPEHLAELLSLIQSGTISGKMAKELLEELPGGIHSPKELIDARGLSQVSDKDELVPLVEGVLSANPRQVEEYRAGKTKVIGYFVGQIMLQTQGKGNPQLINQLLKSRLGR